MEGGSEGKVQKKNRGINGDECDLLLKAQTCAKTAEYLKDHWLHSAESGCQCFSPLCSYRCIVFFFLILVIKLKLPYEL